MDIRMAPMEGVTDAVLRRTHCRCFGGVDRYYIPFISPTQHHVLTPHDLRAVAPEHNQGIHAVPQLLCKDAEHFLWAAGELKTMGYDEVNLNIGCPSGTVTAKGKGSGMLRDLAHLREMLDEVFLHIDMKVSVKTRIGFSSPEEWPEILALLAAYPVSELTIHPRTRSAFYKGEIYREAFAQAAAMRLPLIYNGDLFTAKDCMELQKQYPGIPMMLGRGLIANPALARELKGGSGVSAAELKHFLDMLYDAYRQIYPVQQAHSRMREIAKYVACCFDGAEKPLKAIRKSTPETFEAAVDRLWERPLRDQPGYAMGTWLGV